jgi:lysosomal acid phosphatase
MVQAFQEHVVNVMRSDAFKARAKAAQPFLQKIKDFVYGPEVSFDNMWNVSREYLET